MNIGIASPTMDKVFANVGKRYFTRGIWYREDPHMTLYCLDKDDITPCILLSSYDEACYLCRAKTPHTTLLHDELRYTDEAEQRKLYAEV